MGLKIKPKKQKVRKISYTPQKIQKELTEKTEQEKVIINNRVQNDQEII